MLYLCRAICCELSHDDPDWRSGGVDCSHPLHGFWVDDSGGQSPVFTKFINVSIFSKKDNNNINEEFCETIV